MIDVLIIGAGGAALSAALKAKEHGASVQVLCKGYPTRSQTCMAQGGVNAALSHADEDSVASHIHDTIKSAQGLGCEKAIELMCEEAPKALSWLDRIGVPFSRDENSEIAQRRLGGATHARACYAQDYTGLKMLHTLYDQCNRVGITFLNERFLLNVMTDNTVVNGVTALNLRTGEVEEHLAKSVILATGGYSRIYHDHSTNAAGSTGDGIAAAIRAGARLSDMEFIQFHPTALKKSAVLISESARGAGGYLLNAEYKRFTDELAPRDVVAREILAEIEKSGEVYIDIRHLGEAFINEQLPQERKLAKLYEGVDPVYDLVPIKPAAHYSMGGIEVDSTSQTSVAGLYACGECANHNVHGANRLGGNSLLELVVFGHQAGMNAAQYAKDCTVAINSQQLQQDKNAIQEIKYYTNEIDFYEKHRLMGDSFYEHAAMVRSKRGMQELLAMVHKIHKELPLMGPKDKSTTYNTNIVEFIEFTNMIELSEIILMGALARKESRGAHFRSDAQQRNDENFATHTIVFKEHGKLHVKFDKGVLV
ncbi:MAG: FAD-dependent oxidoreductase [Campylobacterota bacterium]|nr:FAD-dependent oxidoreductase [Campylobacterota bacterium]